MKLGILSDTHNNVPNTHQALAIFREHGAERLIHCGDLTTPPMITWFAGWQIDFVYGNIDGDRDGLHAAIRKTLPDATIGDEFTTQIVGVRVAAIHGDDQRRLNELTHSGLYQFVFCGHSHLRTDETIGRTRLINPGALGGKRSQKRSVCVLDLSTGEAAFVKLADQGA